MSFLKSKPIQNEQNSTMSSTTTTDLPDYVAKGGETAVGIGADLATDPYKAYEGQRVADFSADTQTGFASLRDLLSKAMSSGTQDAAVAGASQYAAAPAQKVGYEGVFDGDFSKYMNQYTDAALAPAMRKIQEASDAARNRIRAAATGSGAPGMFRDARADNMLARNDRDTALAMGETAATASRDAFDRAVSQRMADLQRKTGTDTTNANFAETALGRLLQGTSGAIAQEGAGQQNMLQAIQAMLSSGQMQTAQSQAQLDAEKAKHDETYNYQLSGLDALLKALKAPAEVATTQEGETTGTSTQTGGPSPWATILGSALGAAAKAI